MHILVSHLIVLHASAWSELSTTYTLAKRFHDGSEVPSHVEIVLNCSNNTCFFEGSWQNMKIERANDYEDMIWIWK